MAQHGPSIPYIYHRRKVIDFRRKTVIDKIVKDIFAAFDSDVPQADLFSVTMEDTIKPSVPTCLKKFPTRLSIPKLYRKM